MHKMDDCKFQRDQLVLTINYLQDNNPKVDGLSASLKAICEPGGLPGSIRTA